MANRNKNKLDEHVIFCARDDPNIVQSGRQAELDVVQFLVDNLKTHQVGNYRILVNYNMPFRGGGGAGILEIDLLIINKLGIFLLEVKDWRGVIEARNDAWFIEGLHQRVDALESITRKARIFYGSIFGSQGKPPNFGPVNVIGLVVLARGVDRFINQSNRNVRAVVGKDSNLLQVLKSKQLWFREAEFLTDPAIKHVTEVVLGQYQPKTREVIGNYRILGELSPGDLFDAYEAQHIRIEHRRVRLKVYKLPNLSYQVEENIRLFERSMVAGSILGFHKNILGTYEFFEDPSRSDTFYEVTELVHGDRLDEIMARRKRPFSLERQLNYLEQLCEALIYAHNHADPSGKKSPVYHRNLRPETIFITHNGVVKLADFDFAKLSGEPTINVAGSVFPETPFMAPELVFNASSASPASDIYSLGVLWYFLARLPEQNPKFAYEKIDEQVDTLRKLPEAARTLMKKMLKRAPNSRPQRVEEVLTELKKLRKNK